MWVAQDGVGKRQMVSESATPGRKRCLVKYYLSNIVLIRCYGTGWVVSRTCHRPRCHPSQHLLPARHPADWGLGRRGWYSSVFLWASGAAAGTFRLGCLPPCSLYLHNLGSLTSGASHWALKNIQHVGLDCVNNKKRTLSRMRPDKGLKNKVSWKFCWFYIDMFEMISIK